MQIKFKKKNYTNKDTCNKIIYYKMYCKFKSRRFFNTIISRRTTSTFTITKT